MVRQTLAQEITQYLTEQGAVRVGFADLHGVAGASLPYGITALVALPRELMRWISPSWGMWTPAAQMIPLF